MKTKLNEDVVVCLYLAGLILLALGTGGLFKFIPWVCNASFGSSCSQWLQFKQELDKYTGGNYTTRRPEHDANTLIIELKKPLYWNNTSVSTIIVTEDPNVKCDRLTILAPPFVDNLSVKTFFGVVESTIKYEKELTEIKEKLKQTEKSTTDCVNKMFGMDYVSVTYTGVAK